jgi:hypothetical protein
MLQGCFPNVSVVSSVCCISCSGYTRIYVASVCAKRFICFRCILQVFYLDAAYIAVVIHVCCKHMFHFVSVCCNRGCFLRALTRGQARAALGQVRYALSLALGYARYALSLASTWGSLSY